MAVSNTPTIIPPKVQAGIIELHNQCFSLLDSQWNIREQMRLIDLAYMREQDQTPEHLRAQLANKLGDSTRFQNLTVPVIKPLVEAAVTYQTSVFLTGNPIFGVVASPEFESEALQMNAIIEEQSIRGGWVGQLMQFFRDGFKYNLSALEVTWKREVTAALETDLGFSRTQARPKEVIWEGNAIKRLDLYNTFWDTRVYPTEVASKGEFVGYTELFSRIALKQFIATLPDKIIQNIIPAFESGLGGASVGNKEAYYIPDLNPNALINKNPHAGMDWLSWAGLSGKAGNIRYKNMYEVTTLYARILPSDFGLRVPSENTPQVWKFIIVNHSVLIYAERQTNAHGMLPVLFGQPADDGLGYQTKSMADDVAPMQSLSSALANSWLASRRRAISDRVLYDPSRIASEHINSANPSAKIPVRPSAYGKNIAESVYAFPFRDDQAQTAMAEMQQVQQFAFSLTGQNQAKQGQFVKGNKTLHEYSDVMNHSNGNDQKTALLYEVQIFTPLKEILKINILQYQGGTSLFTRERQEIVQIDPVALRKAVLAFKISDGLTPTEKLISGDAWTTSMQVIGSSPQIGQGYNIAPMFSYLMKTQGADLTPFEKSPQQVSYESAVASWQQVVMEAIKQGADPQKLPPQPTPQAYGYDPATQGSSAAAAAAPAQVSTKVNNITNNITNTGEQ
jgi:hypothetical protein